MAILRLAGSSGGYFCDPVFVTVQMRESRWIAAAIHYELTSGSRGEACKKRKEASAVGKRTLNKVNQSREVI